MTQWVYGIWKFFYAYVHWSTDSCLLMDRTSRSCQSGTRTEYMFMECENLFKKFLILSEEQIMKDPGISVGHKYEELKP